MVPICVSDPMGFASPRRMASTPAIIVVATAPMPTTMIPNLPFAGSTFAAARARRSTAFPALTSALLLLFPFVAIASPNFC
jgi:hypothetical protein